jgi:cyclase
MTRRALTLAFVSLVLGWVLLDAQTVGRAGGPQPAAPAVGSLPAHRFEKVAEGVYYSTPTGSMAVPCNSPVIVNDDEVLVVDPGITPAVARALVEDIKTLTPKPVRFVVDSHYHYDHANGNSAFGPEIALIGHENTRTHLLSNVLQQTTYRIAIDPIPDRIAAWRKQAASEADPEQRAALERQAAVQQLHLEQEKEVRAVPPGMTFHSEMTLYRGSREIRFLYLGRGHTDTDIVVFLPKERIVAIGDQLTMYAVDAFVDEWPETLEKLAALDFDLVLPGHGAPLKGKERIRAFQDYLRDLSRQVTALRQQGLPAEEAAKKVDLTAHAKDFPQLKAPGVDVRTVTRMYDVAANPNPPVR